MIRTKCGLCYTTNWVAERHQPPLMPIPDYSKQLILQSMKALHAGVGVYVFTAEHRTEIERRFNSKRFALEISEKEGYIFICPIRKKIL